MGFTKSCTALALVAVVASVALLLATMFIPNWVKAIWRVPGSDDCVVGNLGAFGAEFFPEAECAVGSPLDEFKNFKSDTLEFWPLFPMQATGNGNPLPGVTNTTFESCEKSLDGLDAAIASQVAPALTAAAAPSQSVRKIALGGAQLVATLVGFLEAQLAQGTAAGQAYLGVLQAAQNPAFGGVEPISNFWNETNPTAVGGMFGAVAGALLAEDGNSTTTAADIEAGFQAISFACGCADPAGNIGSKCPYNTAAVAGNIAGGLAFLGVSVSCAAPDEARIIGEVFGSYQLLNGNGAPNATLVGEFAAGSFQLFEAIKAGQVTDENRFQAMYADLAQAFLANPSVFGFIAATAGASDPALTPAVITSMLGLVKVCACHNNSENAAYNETCDAGTAGLASLFLYADGQIAAPSPLAFGPLDPSCQDILNLAGPSLTFYGQANVVAQATIIQMNFPGNMTLVTEAAEKLANGQTLFANFDMEKVFEDEQEYNYMVGPELNALLVGGGAPDGAIKGVMPLIALCACTVNATAAADEYCNAEKAQQFAGARFLATGSMDIIASGPACFVFATAYSQQSGYKGAWSGATLSGDRTLAEKECAFDNVDQEHITLGRTMLIVALPILIIGTIAGALAAMKASADNESGFKLVAVVAGLCAIISAGLTLFGLLHVRAAPIYAAVGVPCLGPAVCYENDFAATIALGAALAPIIAGVAFLVSALVGLNGESKGDDVESPRDSQIVANPKFSI